MLADTNKPLFDVITGAHHAHNFRLFLLYAQGSTTLESPRSLIRESVDANNGEQNSSWGQINASGFELEIAIGNESAHDVSYKFEHSLGDKKAVTLESIVKPWEGASTTYCGSHSGGSYLKVPVQRSPAVAGHNITHPAYRKLEKGFIQSSSVCCRTL
jgi:hypothetical protein